VITERGFGGSVAREREREELCEWKVREKRRRNKMKEERLKDIYSARGSICIPHWMIHKNIFLVRVGFWN